MTDIAPLVSSLQAVRLWLQRKHPFYASLFSNLRIVATTGVPRAAVDAKDRLYLNPEWFASLGLLQASFVVCHEVLHPALGYFFRSVGHTPERANRAHDYAINLILKAEGHDWLIGDILLDDKYAGLAYEAIYAMLDDEPGGKGGGFGLGDVLSAADGQSLADSPGSVVVKGFSPSGESGSTTEGSSPQVWHARVAKAVATATSYGKESAGMKTVLGEVGTSRVHWRDRLMQAAREGVALARHNYNNPSRRSSAIGTYMPVEEFLAFDVTVCVDSSDSISCENLNTARAEIAELISLCGWRLRWLEGDTKIERDEIIGVAPEFVHGGGGTSFVPFFDRLKNEPTRLLIFFTDTFGEFPDLVPDFPVLWAVYEPAGSSVTNRAVPFGEVIPVPEAELAA